MARATFEPGGKVSRIAMNLDRPERTLKQIGAIMVAESQAAFKAQSFGGVAWPPRAGVNIFGIIDDFASGRAKPPARRFEKRPALRDTGRLAASISFRLVGTHVVEVGTVLPYAGLHNFGGPTESKKITQTVRENLWRWLKTQNLGMKRRVGWLLNSKFKNQTIKGNVPARRFVGITQQTRRYVQRTLGATISEA
jgi:phage gpG-like protein